MSSPALFNPWSFHSLGFAELSHPWPRWALVGSFVLHVAVGVALMDLRFLSVREPKETSYHVSLVAMPAPPPPPASNVRPAEPVVLRSLPPVPDFATLPRMPSPVDSLSAPVQPPEEAPRMAELLTQTMQSVLIPAVTKPQPVTKAPVRVPSKPEDRVRVRTPSVAIPEPPQLARVPIEQASPVPRAPLKADQERLQQAIANLTIPELVSALTVRRPSSMQGSDAFPMDAHYWESIRSRIHQQWLASAMRRLDPRQVVLAFRVERTGQVSGLAVDQSSGSDEYDGMAQRAVAAASPLPPFPSTITEPYLDINFTFRFHLVQ